MQECGYHGFKSVNSRSAKASKVTNLYHVLSIVDSQGTILCSQVSLIIFCLIIENCTVIIALMGPPNIRYWERSSTGLGEDGTRLSLYSSYSPCSVQ